MIFFIIFCSLKENFRFLFFISFFFDVSRYWWRYMATEHSLFSIPYSLFSSLFFLHQMLSTEGTQRLNITASLLIVAAAVLWFFIIHFCFGCSTSHVDDDKIVEIQFCVWLVHYLFSKWKSRRKHTHINSLFCFVWRGSLPILINYARSIRLLVEIIAQSQDESDSQPQYEIRIIPQCKKKAFLMMFLSLLFLFPQNI